MLYCSTVDSTVALCLYQYVPVVLQGVYTRYMYCTAIYSTRVLSSVAISNFYDIAIVAFEYQL